MKNCLFKFEQRAIALVLAFMMVWTSLLQAPVAYAETGDENIQFVFAENTEAENEPAQNSKSSENSEGETDDSVENPDNAKAAADAKDADAEASCDVESKSVATDAGVKRGPAKEDSVQDKGADGESEDGDNATDEETEDAGDQNDAAEGESGVETSAIEDDEDASGGEDGNPSEEDAGEENSNTAEQESEGVEDAEDESEDEYVSDPTADVETLDEIKKSLPLDKLSGDWSEDMALLAENEIGYKESDRNFIENDEGTKNGYTRYGEWYGKPYLDWCTIFAYFCMRFAGVGVSDIPFDEDAAEWMRKIDKEGRMFAADDHAAARGDLVFIEAEDGKTIVGIVSGILTEKDENGKETEYIRIIAGDVENSVQEIKMLPDAKAIIGFGIIPTEHKKDEFKTSVKFEKNEREEGDVAESADVVDFVISGDLPDSGSCEIKPIEAELENGAFVWIAFEITLLDRAGNEAQPEHGAVSVSLSGDRVKNAVDGGVGLTIYHGEKEPQIIPVKLGDDGASLSFNTTGFSPFVLGNNAKGEVSDGDYIHISTYEQLLLIGTCRPVTSSDTKENEIGKGSPVLNSDGEQMYYTADANYWLDNDIPFEGNNIWKITPEFTGTFTCEKETDASRLYDEKSDTIYIQNVYQLSALFAEDREEIPVITGDVSVDTFGRGKLIFTGNEAKKDASESDIQYLTYEKSHKYILSAAFTAKLADSVPVRRGAKSAQTGDNSDRVDGRDYFGQVSVNIDGTTYILIGDRQQLDAINDNGTTRTDVYGPVYSIQQTYTRLGTANYEWVDDPSTEQIVYPGDADLISDVWNGSSTQDFSDKHLYGTADVGHLLINHNYDYRDLGTDGGALIVGSTRTVYCADDGTGHADSGAHTNGDNKAGLKYEKDGNYIVFRDIDMLLTDKDDLNWLPLMFSGVMYGVKADARDDISTLWNAGKTELNIDVDNKPTISNFSVEPATLTQLGDTRLDLSVQTGVGFFGTLTGKMSNTNLMGSQVLVKNIRLADGTVDNETVKADIDVTIVNGLLTGLGALLGTLLDPVLYALTGKNIGLRDMLTGLLNARKKDPASVATGAFAGRIIGNARVEDCEVDNVSVTTIKTGYEDEGHIVGKGGFVGHVEGVTRYDGLSNTLGGVGDALSGLLNAIPGLGLGDIVSVLLDNALPLKDLIPTGYTQPVIERCTVVDGTLSTETGKYGVGGFAGSICGAELIDCTVEDSTMTVMADHFGGGFVGIERDAVIKGTLSGLGVDIGSLHPQSELIRCSIEDSTMTVTGVTYLGGFVGAMMNSYGINDTVSGGTMTVSGTGDYVGGFTGYAHLGSIFAAGNYLVDGESLLSTVKGLVTGLLGSGSDQSLLDVGGVAPSAIMGLQFSTPLTVESDGAFVGGIVGRGNGTYITASTPANLRLLGKYDTKRGGEYNTALPITSAEARNNLVSNLVSVEAGYGRTDASHSDESFAGGIAGYLTSANIGGLLGSATGLGQYLGFTVAETTVQGVLAGYTVSAERDYAGGGIGWAVGGQVYDTELLRLASVEAENHAGGFVGATGPGDLVSGDGLDLSLLGISLISIDNLLSLAAGVRTTYERANVTGITDGFTVEETGSRSGADQTVYVAGGYAAEANSVRMVDCHVNNLLSVVGNDSDGIAGGYIGSSAAGGLAGLASQTTDALSVAQVGNLLDAVPYLIPSYDGCDVHYVNGGYVQADTAGGFAGNFQSGKVNTYTDDGENPIDEESYTYTVGISSEAWSVYNIHHVRGGKYAGGWGGNVYSGALAGSSGGLSLLGSKASVGAVSADQLLGVAQTYVPLIRYAGVNSPSGFSVYAGTYGPAAGYAGGFIGYGSGVQVSYSDVNKLKHGNVAEPMPLEGQDGRSYMRFDNSPNAIPYAVAGAHYAGGYIGHMDIGSAASLGGGLQLLGSNLSLTNVLDALSVVVSTIEHSDVYGAPGGFAVIASSQINVHGGTYDANGVAHAGGYAGKISGGHIQDGNVELFSYIIGEISAGGYVGEMEPGDVAHVLDSGSLSLLGQVNDLASLVQDFVPTIRNSQTTCIPCGGAVRAQCFSSGSILRGMAGGYAGHNKGGQIWGMDTHVWKEQNDEADLFGRMTRGEYTGEQRENAAIRIRSVYGAEYAGGYVGLMECGSTAQTGGLSLLSNLISTSNLLGALQAVYPTVNYGAVYGPLEAPASAPWNWNAWKQYVGMNGTFASELYADDIEQGDVVYGYHVVAGRTTFNQSPITILSGCSGGFAGSMHSGVITHSHAEDAKLVTAMRAAGGFVGEMQTKGLAEFGSVDLLGSALNLNLGNLLNVADVFVPEISESGTTGYDQGVTVLAFGNNANSGVGMAGGYVGAAYGGQLGLHHDTTPSVYIRKLKNVCGTNAVGGFVGKAASASVLSANTTDASSGFLQQLLDSVLTTPNDLVDVLNATICTIKYAEVSAVNPEWGLTINGQYSDGQYAHFVGGFAGSLEASVLGERNNASDTLVVNNLRSVIGGYYTGGFFGLADVGSVAQVGGDDGVGGTTSILSLIQAGNVSLLDAFRTYIYHATVNGVADGLHVYAVNSTHTGSFSSYEESGDAGGFGGALMNGTVEHSSVNHLSYVQAPNYAGGFIGHMGKNGGVSVDQAKVTNQTLLGQLLSAIGLNLDADAQVLNIVGSTIESCAATGFADGFIVKTTNAQTAQAGVVDAAHLKGSAAAGFAGYADISQIMNSQATNLKYVVGKQVAGGFVGRTSVAYIADVDASSALTSVVFDIVNLLVRALYLPQAEQLNILNLDARLVGLKLFSDGDLLWVNLGGIKIAVSLVRNDPEYGGSDAAVITIGSSTIKLPCDENGIQGTQSDISVQLIEGNRTCIKYSTVKGIQVGYDVLGGDANYVNPGTDVLGYTGGFVGINDNGFLSNDTMLLCDIVHGTPDKTGPFVGKSIASTRSLDYLEGTNNKFRIYRTSGLSQAETDGGVVIGTATSDAENAYGYDYYETVHRDVISEHSDMINAVETGGGRRYLEAHQDEATAVLMKGVSQHMNHLADTPMADELLDPCETQFELTITKSWDDTHNMFGTRPSSITINIVQVDVGTTPPAALIVAGAPPSGADVTDEMTMQMTTSDAVSPMLNSAIWRKVYTDKLQVTYTYVDDSGAEPVEETHYYQYYVYETVPGNYEATYEVDASTGSVRIKNTNNRIVIPTGVDISVMHAAFFTAMITVFMLLYWKKRRKTNVKIESRR